MYSRLFEVSQYLLPVRLHEENGVHHFPEVGKQRSNRKQQYRCNQRRHNCQDVNPPVRFSDTAFIWQGVNRQVNHQAVDKKPEASQNIGYTHTHFGYRSGQTKKQEHMGRGKMEKVQNYCPNQKHGYKNNHTVEEHRVQVIRRGSYKSLTHICTKQRRQVGHGNGNHLFQQSKQDAEEEEFRLPRKWNPPNQVPYPIPEAVHQGAPHDNPNQNQTQRHYKR